MNSLSGRKIIIGVTGSIAAYKSAMLVRLLIKSGAEVKVIMTPSAFDFITPLTLSTLSKHPVLSTFTDHNDGTWNNHVELGLWADAFIIAPASANTLAKMCAGICDNLLLATYLSARCPVLVAPAMDLDMLQHPATKQNIETLRSFGNQIIAPGFGELASGLVGDGRMAEPEEIVTSLENHLSSSGRLNGKHVLVTSGPTYEALDPVRFIGNHSTGKMGFALAYALAKQGAQVHLVTGPTDQHTKLSNIHVTHVTSADEMFQACLKFFPESDVTVLAAAVADYKPAVVAENKIKKKSDTLTLELTKTQDIAVALGKQKQTGQIMVGFALETENEIENAFKKLEAKNFDFIVLNSLREPGAGFGHDTNKISILAKDQSIQKFELKSKADVANDIVDVIIEKIHK